MRSGQAVRQDFRTILRLVRPQARILDVGCGEGDLLELLARETGADGRGLEISPEGRLGLPRAGPFGDAG